MQFEKPIRPPETYADIFKALSQLKVVDAAFSERLIQMAKFRNRLVHLYWEIDIEAVYRFIQENLDDFKQFSDQVVEFINKTRVPNNQDHAWPNPVAAGGAVSNQVSPGRAPVAKLSYSSIPSTCLCQKDRLPKSTATCTVHLIKTASPKKYSMKSKPKPKKSQNELRLHQISNLPTQATQATQQTQVTQQTQQTQ